MGKSSKCSLLWFNSFSPLLSHLLFVCLQLSRAVEPCMTLSPKTKASWASTRGTSSLWSKRSTRTGLKGNSAAELDTFPSTTWKWSCPCHTKSSHAGEEHQDDWKIILSQIKCKHSKEVIIFFYFGGGYMRTHICQDWMDHKNSRGGPLGNKRMMWCLGAFVIISLYKLFLAPKHFFTLHLYNQSKGNCESASKKSNYSIFLMWFYSPYNIFCFIYLEYWNYTKTCCASRL